MGHKIGIVLFIQLKTTYLSSPYGRGLIAPYEQLVCPVIWLNYYLPVHLTSIKRKNNTESAKVGNYITYFILKFGACVKYIMQSHTWTSLDADVEYGA